MNKHNTVLKSPSLPTLPTLSRTPDTPDETSSQGHIQHVELAEFSIDEEKHVIDDELEALTGTSALPPSRQSGDQYSFRSGTSQSSLQNNNNHGRLATVEDGIKRLDIPELVALKHEQKVQNNRERFEESTRKSNVLGRRRRVPKMLGTPDLEPQASLAIDDHGCEAPRSGDSVERHKEHTSSQEQMESPPKTPSSHNRAKSWNARDVPSSSILTHAVSERDDWMVPTTFPLDVQRYEEPSATASRANQNAVEVDHPSRDGPARGSATNELDSQHLVGALGIHPEDWLGQAEHAIKWGKLQSMQQLLAEGLDEAIHPIARHDLLMMAVSSNNTAIVRLLLDKGARVPRIKWEARLLSKSLDHDDNDVLQLLLDRGIDASLTLDDDDETALHIAARNGNYERAEILLCAGALVDAEAANGLTPLYTAAKCNQQEIVSLLLEFNARVNWPTLEHDEMIPVDPIRGLSPLHIAAALPNVEMMKMLLDAHAEMESRTPSLSYDVFERDFRNELPIHAHFTPLHVAVVGADEGHEEAVGLLLQRRANIMARTGTEETPLHLAAQCSTVGVVAMLLESGADAAAASYFNATPLHDAAARAVVGDDDHFLETLRLLLKHGADINAMAVRGTALHVAVDLVAKARVQALIDNGASLIRKPYGDESPLDIAAAAGSLEIVELLLQTLVRELEQKVKRKAIKSAIAKAKHEKHKDIVKLLEKDLPPTFSFKNLPRTPEIDRGLLFVDRMVGSS